MRQSELAAAKLPDDKRRLQQQIDAADRQIDRLVYTDFYQVIQNSLYNFI